jgi:hypothetical protein
MGVLDFLGLGDSACTQGASYGADEWQPTLDHVPLDQGHGSTSQKSKDQQPTNTVEIDFTKYKYFITINDVDHELHNPELDEDQDVIFDALVIESTTEPKQAPKTVGKSDWMSATFKAAANRGAIPLMQPVKQPLFMVDVQHNVKVASAGAWISIAVEQDQLHPGYYK